MKKFIHTVPFHFAWGEIFLVIALLLFSLSAQATAPRIAPKLFGEEVKADILRYRLEPLKGVPKFESEMLAEIATEAFKAAGKAPVLELQPSKQLAKYALFNKEVVAVIGSARDFSSKEKKSYRLVTFYLRGASLEGEPVALAFNRQAVHGDELYQAFNMGMQAILANGKYLELLERYHDKDKIPADYVGRLTRHNPGWK